MKRCVAGRCVLALLILAGASGFLQAAFIKDLPLTLVQPDGRKVSAFVTGDEFHRWVHDRNGYAILKDPSTGEFVYAVRGRGGVVASRYRVDARSAQALGLEKSLGAEWAAQNPSLRPRLERARVAGAPSTGTINNLVIFIRFSDDSEFGEPISLYDGWFNASGASSNSLGEYFFETSYNQLSISSTFYPPSVGGFVVSYQDSYPRGYYRPYDAVSNPIGYTGYEGGFREQALLKAAVTAIASQVPTDLNIDADSDGLVDAICFIIVGGTDAWASLLWPHASFLPYEPYVYINGKRASAYNLQIQDYMKPNVVGVGVLCHEMFHILGAPDLYRYTDRSIEPVSIWDIMGSPDNPPQHTGAYMKHQYGHWLDSIPEITSPGTYSLNPLASPTGNCYRIKSPASSTEYFVLEYRKKVGIYEGTIAVEGLLVYRINTLAHGDESPPDEVYIYRVNGTLTVNGDPYTAVFSQEEARTALDDTTNPSCFLSDGTEGKLRLSDVGSLGDTISFSVDWSYTPSLTTAAVTNIGTTAANGGGSVTVDFGDAVTDRGVCWSTSPRPTIDGPHEHAGSGLGAFSVPVTGLVPATLYHLRAFATNSSGTGYGTEVTFSTLPLPVFAVTSPAFGDRWARGASQTIIWTKGASTGAWVKIELFRAGIKVKSIALKAPNNGSYVWTVPPAMGTSTEYQVRVRTLDGLYSAQSANFTIFLPSLTVTEPTRGTVWTRGSAITITWAKAGAQNANVKILLFKGTTKVRDIALSTPNDEAFDWTIPTSLAPAANYKIKIKTLDGLVTGLSVPFAIQ